MQKCPFYGILHLSVYTLKSGSLSRANCFDPDPDPDPDLESVNHFPGFMKDARFILEIFTKKPANAGIAANFDGRPREHPFRCDDSSIFYTVRINGATFEFCSPATKQRAASVFPLPIG